MQQEPQEGFNPKELSDEEKIVEAQNIRLIIRESVLYSQGRANEASIEFIRLEVQLATLLLGLTGIFWNVYSTSIPEGAHLGNYIKIAFALVLFLLIGSIALGLLYLKIVEKYWDGITNIGALRFNKWQEVIRKNTTFKEAVAFHAGTNLDGGNMVYTPEWPWILQSILLSVSLAIIFCLAVKLIILS